ncbi:phosphoheptose isomerase [Algoriphagus halophytocola]|uniref:Phosphoheptose isomerase n=1 Tax=Algoriphagus halophytocola TaxID=2991499 RepID=A0ABY6MJT6_9BACT|nr:MULTISPECIES: phosphoheptose isomerase [unclassified Algoriphagus]UZD24047.1 phosphoheptose isomerase [Algoriphagus sp. TR-M5]WBL41419.1 phosphoheptose isomerase [Algoriphagus sp. TR-M9]
MTVIDINAGLSKDEVFLKVEEYLKDKGFRISQVDKTRPWGGFFVLDESQIRSFRESFFDEVSLSEQQLQQKLSPKFLIVAPSARLSWQYHFRRAELWKLIEGEAGLVRSETDEEQEQVSMMKGQTISLKQGERHRLVGRENWGIVAEIWMHVDPENPSNEEDIVRVSDDYSRK